MVLPVYQLEERTPGVYSALLAPSRCQLLARLLVDDRGSWVWLVAFHPHHASEWVELALPLVIDRPAERVRARLPRYDLQFPVADFVERLPSLRAPAGMLALQMAQPVPDTLIFEHIAHDPDRHRILRQHGWLFTFDLPHDGARPWVECPDRGHLERLLADPAFVTGEVKDI